MEKINLTNEHDENNTPDNTGVIFSVEQARFIEDFKMMLDTEGVVCRNDVLSLERLLDSTFITEDIPANSFTELRTQAGLHKLVDKLNGLELPMSVTPALTMKTVIMYLEEILEAAVRIKAISNPETISPKLRNLYNDIHAYGYTNYQGQDKSEIYDTNDTDIYLHVAFNPEFANHYFLNHHYENFKRLILNPNNSIKDTVMLPFFFAMKDDELVSIKEAIKSYREDVVTFNVSRVTQRDLIEMLLNGNIYKSVNDIIDVVKQRINNINQGYENNTTPENLKHKTIKNIISDPVSYQIINMYKHIKTSSLEV